MVVLMSDRDNRVVTYLTDKEYMQLKKWSQESDKAIAHLLREAILEYTDRDRAARIEDKLDHVLAVIGEEDYTHTHGIGSGTKSVPEKARDIASRCYQNHEVPIQDTDVQIAIEDIAGGDDRTVEKYKEQLKKRGLLYKHPLQPVWTDDKEQWVEWIENGTVDGDIHKFTDEYDVTVAEYDRIAAEVSE